MEIKDKITYKRMNRKERKKYLVSRDVNGFLVGDGAVNPPALVENNSSNQHASQCCA